MGSEDSPLVVVTGDHSLDILLKGLAGFKDQGHRFFHFLYLGHHPVQISNQLGDEVKVTNLKGVSDLNALARTIQSDINHGDRSCVINLGGIITDDPIDRLVDSLTIGTMEATKGKILFGPSGSESYFMRRLFSGWDFSTLPEQLEEKVDQWRINNKITSGQPGPTLKRFLDLGQGTYYSFFSPMVNLVHGKVLLNDVSVRGYNSSTANPLLARKDALIIGGEIEAQYDQRSVDTFVTFVDKRAHETFLYLRYLLPISPYTLCSDWFKEKFLTESLYCKTSPNPTNISFSLDSKAFLEYSNPGELAERIKEIRKWGYSFGLNQDNFEIDGLTPPPSFRLVNFDMFKKGLNRTVLERIREYSSNEGIVGVSVDRLSDLKDDVVSLLDQGICYAKLDSGMETPYC